MPFEAGREKTGGRVAGTPNKKNKLVAQFFESNEINLIEKIWQEVVEISDPIVRTKFMMDLLQYCCPKTRSIEFVDKTESEEINITKENLHELYEIARKC